MNIIRRIRSVFRSNGKTDDSVAVLGSVEEMEKRMDAITTSVPRIDMSEEDWENCFQSADEEYEI